MNVLAIHFLQLIWEGEEQEQSSGHVEMTVTLGSWLPWAQAAFLSVTGLLCDADETFIWTVPSRR